MANVRLSTLNYVTRFYKSCTSYSRLLYCSLLLLCVFHCSCAAPRAEASMGSPRSKLLEIGSDSNNIAISDSRNHNRLLSEFENDRKNNRDNDESGSNKVSHREEGAIMSGMAQAQEVRYTDDNEDHAATNTESRGNAPEKENDAHQVKRKYSQGYRSRVQIDYKTVYDRQRMLDGLRQSGKAGKSLAKGFESALTLEEAKWYPDYVFIFPDESEDTADQDRDEAMNDREQQGQGQAQDTWQAHAQGGGGDQQQPSSQPPESTANSSDWSDAGRSKVVNHNYYFRDYYWDPDSYPHEKAVDYRIEIPVVWQAEPETSPPTTTTTSTTTETTSTTIANQTTTTTPQPVTSTQPDSAPSTFALDSFVFTHLAILAVFSAAFALVEV